MECFTGLFVLVAIIIWAIKTMDGSGQKENRGRARARQSEDDQVYMDAFLSLDAAQDGIFPPWGENAVRRADRAFMGDTTRNHSHYVEEDDGPDWNDYGNDEEAEDHWGPV